MGILDDWYEMRTEEFIKDKSFCTGKSIENLIRNGWLPLGVNADDPRVKQIVEKIKNDEK